MKRVLMRARSSWSHLHRYQADSLVLITPIRRGTDLPLRERFFIQALSPADAAQRAKFSAQDMKKVKSLIDKNAWSFVQNGLRSSAGYLRYDLNTVITSKPKEERKSFKALSAKLFDSLNAPLARAFSLRAVPTRIFGRQSSTRGVSQLFLAISEPNLQGCLLRMVKQNHLANCPCGRFTVFNQWHGDDTVSTDKLLRYECDTNLHLGFYRFWSLQSNGRCS
uniref:Uncharacterized protein n=2 Tax=Physcomitrium patens TaxID=3218 RepID=A0A2K1KGE2_PHYPA|nr:hypothetical protein PHYPA_009235 [Physcomitrium patens]